MNRISNSDFDKYISNINITKTEETRLMSSHKNVREKLTSSELNKNIQTTILSGSYKKRTMIKQGVNSNKTTDVDILVIFDFKKENKNPYSLLSTVRNYIEEIPVYQGKTTLQKRSIGIELSLTHIDVIPVLEVNSGSNKPLLISTPGKQDWEETDPIKSIEYFNSNAQDLPYLRAITKALKWWKTMHKPENYRYPISYAFEVLAIMFYHKTNDKFECLVETFNNINNAFQKNSSKPTLEDPCKIGNDLLNKMNDASYLSFRTKFDKHTKKLIEGINENNIQNIIDVLGTEFPRCSIIEEEIIRKSVVNTSHAK